MNTAQLSSGKPKVLAIASAGGHWVQLRRLRRAFLNCRLHWVTTQAAYEQEVRAIATEEETDQPGFHTITDANRWQKLRLIRQLLEIGWIMLRIRPHYVISTGAAPGFFALVIGKLTGAKTIWLDSIANAEELSLSGKQAGRFADLYLTQWPELAGEEDNKEGKPLFMGSVI